MAAATNPYVLAFSGAVFLYVGVEAAIYVWMPTLLAGYRGRFTWLAAYDISIFFALRAAGRFVGAWMLLRWRWQAAVAALSGGILACFALSVAGGVEWAVYLLPASGLFMAVLYPTLNSKGISCVRRGEHGAAAGVILFFTCLSAVTAPLAMGALNLTAHTTDHALHYEGSSNFESAELALQGQTELHGDFQTQAKPWAHPQGAARSMLRYAVLGLPDGAPLPVVLRVLLCALPRPRHLGEFRPRR